AALAAARDLGRIVVEDPYYGYIGLADGKPCCPATMARDGEPLPVSGINTLIATTRQLTVIADALNNDELKMLAHKEYIESQRAAGLLQQKLTEAISLNGHYQAKDANGNELRPYESAREAFVNNLGSMPFAQNARLADFSLSLGWLSSDADSNT